MSLTLSNKGYKKSFPSQVLGPRTLIRGRNGSGKSTILESIEFALTGRIKRLGERYSEALICSNNNDIDISLITPDHNIHRTATVKKHEVTIDNQKYSIFDAKNSIAATTALFTLNDVDFCSSSKQLAAKIADLFPSSTTSHPKILDLIKKLDVYDKINTEWYNQFRTAIEKALLSFQMFPSILAARNAMEDLNVLKTKEAAGIKDSNAAINALRLIPYLIETQFNEKIIEDLSKIIEEEIYSYQDDIKEHEDRIKILSKINEIVYACQIEAINHDKTLLKTPMNKIENILGKKFFFEIPILSTDSFDLGIEDSNSRIPLNALSNGESTTFLSLLPAYILEQKPQPTKILLLELEKLDFKSMANLLLALDDTNIDFIIATIPTNDDLLFSSAFDIGRFADGELLLSK